MWIPYESFYFESNLQFILLNLRKGYFYSQSYLYIYYNFKGNFFSLF